jgi:hypothetical protein
MPRSILRRLSGIVSGIAFALAVAGPVQWDSCPVHGGHAHGAMAATHVHGHAVGAHDTHGGQGGAHQCTCPDCCCGSASVALFLAPVDVRFTEPRVVLHRDFPRAVAELATAPQVVLPYPHAPPSLPVQG